MDYVKLFNQKATPPPITVREAVLLSLLGDVNTITVVEIQDLLERKTHQRPRTSTLYALIEDMLDKGWVQIVDCEKGEGRGRPRRCFQLSLKGYRALDFVREQFSYASPVSQVSIDDELPLT